MSKPPPTSSSRRRATSTPTCPLGLRYGRLCVCIFVVVFVSGFRGMQVCVFCCVFKGFSARLFLDRIFFISRLLMYLDKYTYYYRYLKKDLNSCFCVFVFRWICMVVSCVCYEYVSRKHTSPTLIKCSFCTACLAYS